MNTLIRTIAVCTVLILGTAGTAEAARRIRQRPIVTRTSRTAVASSSSSRSSSSVSSKNNRHDSAINHTRWRLRNEQRRADLTTIANAIFSWKRDSGQPLPKSIPIDEQIEICRPTSTDCSGMADLSALFADYLEEVPVDPQAPKDSRGTRYTISKDWKDRFTVWAPDAEEGWVLRNSK